MNIRTSADSDVASIAALFTESAHQIATKSYTPEQLVAWAPEPPDLAQWRERLAPLETLVAEFDGAMAGFISYTDRGHIEFLFTSPAFSRKGVASKLYEMAEQRLHLNGAKKLSADASIEARPFFESKGFTTVAEQVVERNGVQLRRFAMIRTYDDKNVQHNHAADARNSRGRRQTADGRRQTADGRRQTADGRRQTLSVKIFIMDPTQIVDYWFTEKMRKHWFSSTAEIDAEIKSNYEKAWKSAASGQYDEWKHTPEGCLALTILLDQMPLNMFRGCAKSFETESKAIEVALFAVANGFDKKISSDKLPFLFMPLMHSEKLEDQDLSVKLFEQYNLISNLRFAQHHREIVRRYGRFPHRNRILGRKSTKEEIEYLESENSFKG